MYISHAQKIINSHNVDIGNLSDIDAQRILTAELLKRDLLKFMQVFFEYLNGRPFIIPNPPGRRSHVHITVEALLSVFYQPNQRVVINMAPGLFKSTMLCYFVAWAFAHYPDCNFIYTSYSKDIASMQTDTIRKIITSQMYRDLFPQVRLRHTAKGKEYFETTAGGAVTAAGTEGTITGKNAGFMLAPGVPIRFTGALLFDDLMKPKDSHSDTITANTIINYKETLEPRLRSQHVPIFCIAQRLSQRDPVAYFLSGEDGHKWKRYIIESLDANNNPIFPEKDSLEDLLKLKQFSEYVFYSQHQQNPIPAGGALFKREDFLLLDVEPEFICTFIIADTAETEKTYNDASAFTFFGLYKVHDFSHQQDELFALHRIEHLEIRVEPRELEDVAVSFVTKCMMHKTPPAFLGIEKKSTGVTLCSVLKDNRLIKVREIDRTIKSGSKGNRYINMQHYISRRLVTLTKYSPYAKEFIEHMIQITPDNTHKHDDICDTVSDAIEIALMNKHFAYSYTAAKKENLNLNLSGIVDTTRRSYNEYTQL